MAGPGLRAYEIGRVLRDAADAEVTIAGVAPDSGGDLGLPRLTYTHQDPSPLRNAIRAADAIVAPPPTPMMAALLRRSRARLIFDLCTPDALEGLEQYRGSHAAYRRLMTVLSVDRLGEALRLGHHFVCAGERQRDLWLGAMLGQHLIRPDVRYDADPTYRSVIDVVPFGLPAEPAERAGAGGPRTRWRLPDEAEVVLWNAGIWNWFDAPTAIRAVAALAQRRPQVRLVFMATGHDAAATEARLVARELGALDRIVFFNDGWVPYGERADWLLDAQCAISTHVEHLETRFAVRTRAADCFWARLPIVCTRGDELADRVARDELGATAPPRDPAAVADALFAVLERGKESYAPRLDAAAERLTWERAAEPLVRYVTADERPSRPGERPLVAPRPVVPSVRGLAYRGIRNALNAAGLRRWPSA